MLRHTHRCRPGATSVESCTTFASSLPCKTFQTSCGGFHVRRRGVRNTSSSVRRILSYLLPTVRLILNGKALLMKYRASTSRKESAGTRWCCMCLCMAAVQFQSRSVSALPPINSETGQCKAHPPGRDVHHLLLHQELDAVHPLVVQSHGDGRGVLGHEPAVRHLVMGDQPPACAEAPQQAGSAEPF